MKDQTNTTQGSSKIKQTKRLYAVLALVIFVVLVVGVSKIVSNNNKPTKAAPVAVVRITQSGFVPSTLSVKKGTHVVWTNSDMALHQVASNPFPKDNGLPALKSEILNNTQTYTYVANTAGSFGYHDQMQPTTNGTLVIRK